MLVPVLAVLSLFASNQETPKWAKPGDVGYQRFSSANGFIYLEIELTADRPLSQTSGAEFRLVMQRRATPRRTPRGARATNPLPLVEGDVLLAEGSLRTDKDFLPKID